MVINTGGAEKQKASKTRKKKWFGLCKRKNHLLVASFTFIARLSDKLLTIKSINKRCTWLAYCVFKKILISFFEKVFLNLLKTKWSSRKHIASNAQSCFSYLNLQELQLGCGWKLWGRYIVPLWPSGKWGARRGGWRPYMLPLAEGGLQSCAGHILLLYNIYWGSVHQVLPGSLWITIFF